jgi:hypothetical protein
MIPYAPAGRRTGRLEGGSAWGENKQSEVQKVRVLSPAPLKSFSYMSRLASARARVGTL